MAIIDKALDGKVALVTGGSRGIGRAICVALAQRGAKVIINYASNAAAAEATAAEVEKAGGAPVLAPFDVSDKEAVSSAIKSLGKEHGGLHILVNNAGIAINGLLMRFKADDYSRIMDVNVGGAFWCCQAASSLILRAKGDGRIINLSSVVGEMGNAGQTAYATTKAAIIGATKAMAREFAGRGVCVNAVAPGFIATDMTDEHMTDDARESMLAEIPLGRIAEPHEVADTVAFLAGPEAGYITGQVIRVNGGLLM